MNQVYLDSLKDKVSSLTNELQLWDLMSHIWNSGMNSNQSAAFWIMTTFKTDFERWKMLKNIAKAI